MMEFFGKIIEDGDSMGGILMYHPMLPKPFCAIRSDSLQQDNFRKATDIVGTLGKQSCGVRTCCSWKVCRLFRIWS